MWQRAATIRKVFREICRHRPRFSARAVAEPVLQHTDNDRTNGFLQGHSTYKILSA
jgi:hypothetical protein